MKLECIKDVVMNGTSKIELFKGKTYEAFNHKRYDPPELTVCVRNNSGDTHHVKSLDNDRLDEFFGEHFKEVEEPNYFDAARLNLDKSNCLRRHYACVIVMGGQIISWGHNQSLIGCTECAREGIEHNAGSYDGCPAVHAEQMCLIKARENSLEGAELYLVCDKDADPEPCPMCQKMLDFAGVKQVKETT